MSGQRGFTLAELLVSLAMLAMVLAGIYSLQRQGQFAYLMGAARVEAQQNARTALDLMAKQIRGIQGTAGLSVGTCDVPTTGTSDITFTTWDDEAAGGVGDWVVVRYRLNGTQIERTVNGAMTVLVGGVTSLAFECFTSDGARTAAAANVRRILISIQTRAEDQTNPTSPSYQQMNAQTEVRLRNVL